MTDPIKKQPSGRTDASLRAENYAKLAEANKGVILHQQFSMVKTGVTGGNDIMIMTFPKQNTNGGDLKCAVTDFSYGGGVSCNWQDAIRPEVIESKAAPTGGTAVHKAMPTP